MQLTGVITAIVLCLSSIASAKAQERHDHAATGAALGSVAFPNSGKPSAQPHFLRGLALLHSFEYEEAAEAFREAQRADPAFAMAYWAEALTYIHPLWGEDDPASARKALARLGSTGEARLQKGGSSRERAYGAAIEALLADNDRPSRLRGFAAGMRKVVAAYPNDPEAVAFTSLALMAVAADGNLPADQHAAAQDDAVTFAQRVFKESPEHPGGAHYLIHATDDPTRAARGLEAARRYAEIAPSSQHALHMPSHIFVQLGLWRDAVASDERAWAASKEEVAARQLSNANLSFHSLEWLQYAYLQSGRYAAARGAIEAAKQALADVDLTQALHVDPRHAVSRLRFQYAANSDEWAGEICNIRPTVPSDSRSARQQQFEAVAWYQAIIATAMCHGVSEAERAAKLMPSEKAPHQTAARLHGLATLHLQLLSYIRIADDRGDIDALIAAANAFPSPPPIGPPLTLRTEELLGQALLKTRRSREAVSVYEKALQLTPNRSSALLGLARAHRAAGNESAASAAFNRLLTNWEKADVSPSLLQEVKDGASARRGIVQ